MQPGSIDAGWDAVAPHIERVATEGQLQAAQQAPRYVTAAMREQGTVRTDGVIVPQSFTGATIEGRGVAPELFTAVTATKQLIRRGVGVGAAFQFGTAVMRLMAAQLVRDAGNMADKVAGIGKRSVMMARIVNPGACSRCAVLAGVGHFTRHFERHPGCRCTTLPVASLDDLPTDVIVSPVDYFEQLTRAEQDRIYTKAGAEAIRLGADPISVVNARRGMYRTSQPGSLVARAVPRTITGPDGVQFRAYATTEGTTIRGQFGRNANTGYTLSATDRYRRTTSVRLMPETIIDQAGDDPARAVELLKQFGYMR